MRKRIGLLTMHPETPTQKEIIDGIFAQSLSYGYDVYVFAPLTEISNYYKEYLKGEVNIYEMINFDLLDGVIVMPVPMTEERTTYLVDHLLDKIKKECKAPVVSIDLAFGDYPMVRTDDKGAFVAITEHLLNVHHCKDFMVLAGPEDYNLSDERVASIVDTLALNGIDLPKDRIVYGDFWYTSGEALAEKLVSGEIKMPEAVICCSDHMAIGLANRLIAKGVRVPEDVIITGYGSTDEGVLNTPPITTYAPESNMVGKAAVNRLHEDMEPDVPNMPLMRPEKENLCIGWTCGCKEDLEYTRNRLMQSSYKARRNYGEESWEDIDIGLLLESYTTERLTATSTPRECIGKIYESLYLMKPYDWFYLCLSEDWLDTSKDREVGYPDTMQMVIISDMAKRKHGYENHVFVEEGTQKFFPTKQMLPYLELIPEEPQVFYFSPVHFESTMLGYAIMQYNLSEKKQIGMPYRCFLRYINNALEMIRVRNRITDMSEQDIMTGLLNRRGMENAVAKMLAKEDCGDTWIACVIDMDGLKKLNDEKGHEAGDKGICALAEAVRKIAGENEVAIRAGGDEFYMVGLGHYGEKDCNRKIREFFDALTAVNEHEGATYSASIGCAVLKRTDDDSYSKALSIADRNMYDLKAKHKQSRR